MGTTSARLNAKVRVTPSRGRAVPHGAMLRACVHRGTARNARCAAARPRRALAPRSPDIWREFGACPLAFAEYLLIGAAGLLFPGDLLNDEGVNRAASDAEAGAGAPGGPSCGSAP